MHHLFYLDLVKKISGLLGAKTSRAPIGCSLCLVKLNDKRKVFISKVRRMNGITNNSYCRTIFTCILANSIKCKNNSAIATKFFLNCDLSFKVW